MELAQRNKRIIYASIIFLYQSVIDFFRDDIATFLDNQNIKILSFSITGIFLFVLIIHRAFIHGIIIRILTQQKKLLKYYVVIDISMFSFFFLYEVLNNFMKFGKYPEILKDTFHKFLSTPILLMIFLSAYFIFMEIEKLENKKDES
ncbi:MAG: hypothetical protein GY827_07670 [Cytophagales bacterium]|nr:hypothetical protein [Cytophagales bacterium]